MELLLTLDDKDYAPDMPVVEMVTVRAIIQRDGRYSMQQSAEGWYKIPGGGVEHGESRLETLLREVEEEVGLVIVPDSLREIGAVLEKREDRKCPGQIFLRHTYYYACDVTGEIRPTAMTESEIALGFHPAWATLEEIVSTNDRFIAQGKCKNDTRDVEFLRLALNGQISL